MTWAEDVGRTHWHNHRGLDLRRFFILSGLPICRSFCAEIGLFPWAHKWGPLIGTKISLQKIWRNNNPENVILRLLRFFSEIKTQLILIPEIPGNDDKNASVKIFLGKVGMGISTRSRSHGHKSTTIFATISHKIGIFQFSNLVYFIFWPTNLWHISNRHSGTHFRRFSESCF